MKRVAICMRGAVSKVNTKFLGVQGYATSGDYIDFRKCYNSIVRHILQPNQNEFSFDFFCHCWNEDLQSEILQMYNPVRYRFETNSKYKDEISAKVLIPHIFNNTPVCNDPNIESTIYREIQKVTSPDILTQVVYTEDYAGISQALTIQKAIELKEQYEAESGITYDLVLLYRYDVLLWKDILLKNYLDLEKKIYVNGHDDSNGDFHFVMNRNTSSEFKNLYHSACNGNKHKLHGWIKNYVQNYLRFELRMDDIIPGEHQNVLRKLEEDSIPKGFITHKQIDSYSSI